MRRLPKMLLMLVYGLLCVVEWLSARARAEIEKVLFPEPKEGAQ